MKYLHSNKNWSISKDYNIDKLLYLMIDRPNEIYSYNDFIWKNDKNQYHRNYDLPSLTFIYNDESCSLHWRANGKQYRKKSKPAYIRNDGYKQYCINGIIFKEQYSK